MNFIKKHKAPLIIILICLILIVLAGFAVYRMFYPSGDKSIYGDRLKNAPVIENETINEIKDELINTNLVNNVDYKTSVRIMKFFIDVKNETSIDDAKALTSIVIEKLNSKVISFYDIEIYLTQKEGTDSSYPAIGYHNKDSEQFSWTINKAGELNEE